MGGQPSVERPDYMSFMANLSLRDYKNDTTFWTELISLAPSRSDLPLPYPRLMNEIAVKFPSNFLRLVLICVQHINLMKSGDSGHLYPDVMLDQFSLSINILIACIEALVYNEKLFAVLKKLDVHLAKSYLEARPMLAKLAKEANKQKTTDQAALHPIIQAMMANEGRVVESLISSLCACLYKKGMTLDPKEEEWIQNSQNAKIFNPMRTSVVHFLLFLHSLNFFLPKEMEPKPNFVVDFSEFPYSSFIISVSNVAAKYISNTYNKIVEIDNQKLLLNCYALLNRFFTLKEFQKSFAKVECSQLILSFILPQLLKESTDSIKSGNPTKYPLIFQPLDPLASESLTFLYMSLLFHPELKNYIAKNGFSNRFIYYLLYASQYTFEQLGVCYIHSIILSCILLLVEPEEASEMLNLNFLYSFPCNLRPHIGSYADLLLEVLLKVCIRNPNFMPSLASIFQMISSNVYSFSLYSAVNLMKVFEFIAKSNEQPQLVNLFLNAFAEIVQKRENNDNNFRVVITQKAALFKQMKKDSNNEKALNIINKFASTAKKELKKKDKTKIDIDSVKSILSTINIEQLYPEIYKFPKHPHIYGGEMENTWNGWADLTFEKAFSEEIERMGSMIREINLQEIIQKEQKQMEEKLTAQDNLRTPPPQKNNENSTEINPKSQQNKEQEDTKDKQENSSKEQKKSNKEKILNVQKQTKQQEQQTEQIQHKKTPKPKEQNSKVQPNEQPKKKETKTKQQQIELKKKKQTKQ